jgi:outer membrane biosynthesis protein TonB
VLSLSNDNERAVGPSTRLVRPNPPESHEWRRWAVVGANMAAPSLLCLSLARIGAGIELLPWYLCAVGLSLFSLAQLGSRDEDHTVALIPASREPLKFGESFAFSFFAISLLIWCGGLEVHKPETKVMQMVDIQFLSKNDAANLNSPLPGSTRAQESQLRKRRADEVTLQGNPSSSSVVSPPTSAQASVRESHSSPSPKKSEQEQFAEHIQEKKSVDKAVNKTKRKGAAEPNSNLKQAEIVASETESSPAEAALVIPASWSTRKAQAPQVVVPRQSRTDSRQTPFISEVEPPEMVELIENDGDTNALQVFQRGGDSTGGRGKENGLSRYLKELHRKIKSSWSPPKGTSLRVELIFRIKRDGSLASVRISGTSGEQEADRSAIGAIVGATRKPTPLPADYEPDSLDVLYTFNYNVDELQEVK